MNYETISRGVILAVTLASVFTVSVSTLMILIKRAQFFSGQSRALVSVALSILFLVALFYFLVGPTGAYQPPGSDGVVKATGHSLLPGVALGVAAALVLAQVLLLASKTPTDEKLESLAKKPEPSAKSKSPGRPKKNEQKPSPSSQKPSGKRKNEAKVIPIEEDTTT